MGTDILVIGLGGVGRNCFELLVRDHRVSSIIGSDTKEKYGHGVVNIATAGAAHMGVWVNYSIR